MQKHNLNSITNKIFFKKI